ncbi:uncharacterized protein PFL1_04457 [Pseudozyma flocculosa PF-1]|uniref:tRNA-splicing endonuclease subunit Sen54 N-terminal domain-containing protein n=1 Tax=Pseudozyma flocculosa PF-1 TaxID=1277687 RepID=A0A061H7Y9_9BASI|nr:uncharacterized protein PFL1_04457 [Pseudozyma flocculosa PF-1]EPQ28130.1 hypothetical protein PFL1_04457 [Pseudozyma flocculosa PF-1]
MAATQQQQPSTPQRGRRAATPSTPATPATPASPASPFVSVAEDDLEQPTANATASASANAGPSTPSRGPSAAPAGGDDSEGEDEMPDYLRLAALTSKAAGSKAKSGTAAAAAPVAIPKRGEKDFEPTGFGGQSKLLERSREAMINAISGERRSMNKGLTTASWDPLLCRAVVHELQGKMFETTGQMARRQVLVDDDCDDGDRRQGQRDIARPAGDQAPTQGKAPRYKTVSRNELLPEEALFLLERGSLVLFARPPPPTFDGEGADAAATAADDAREAWRREQVEPMSLQQAFATLRAADVDRIRSEKPPPSSADRRRKKAAAFPAAAAATDSNTSDSTRIEEKGILADPKRPLKLVNDLDLLLYVPRRIWQLLGDAAHWVAQWMRSVSARMAAIASRVVSGRRSSSSSSSAASSASAASSSSLLGLGTGGGGGRHRGLLGSPKWDSYNGVYETLQIVPSGHDRPFPTRPTPLPRRAGSAADDEVDLRPFYYAWRPATAYRKTHPPPPEFRIAIIDAKRQPVPSAWEFETMFGAVPLPGSLEELGLEASSGGGKNHNDGDGNDKDDKDDGEEEEERRRRIEYELELKRRTEEANKRAYGKSSAGRLKFLEDKKKQRSDFKVQRRLQRAGRLERWLGVETVDGISARLAPLARAGRAWSSLFRACPGVLPAPAYVAARPSSSSSSSWAATEGGDRAGAGGKEFTPPSNPFPTLKAGRKTIVLAVVQDGITMLLRFGEAEFERYRLAGRDRPGEVK